MIRLNRRSHVARKIWFIACLFVLMIIEPSLLFATSSKRRAPSQEEYYSTVAVGVSEASLKKADVLRQKTISSIKSLLKSKRTPKSREFELRLRLGELHAERHDHLRDLEMNRYDRAYQKWIATGKKGREPKLSTRGSRAELAEAANAFRHLVNRFPKHPRTAAALYSLGKTLGRLNNPSAAKYFQKLIKNHPKSELIPEAHLALGEYYFEKSDVDNAIRSYRKMLKYKQHASYPYAMYKLGWSYYNAAPKKGKSARALRKKSIAAFKLVVRLAGSRSRSGTRMNLREEALNDLVMAWSESEDVDSAWAYFRSVGEKNSFYDVLQRLGGMYESQGKSGRALAVYRRLLKEAPIRQGNPEIYAKVVKMYEDRGDLAKVARSLKEMNRLYVKGSPWTVINGRNPEVAAAAKQVVEFQLHRHGTLYHQIGQKTKNEKFLKSAAGIYEQYLDTFADHKNAYEVRYYYADILSVLKKHESAAKQFDAVAQQKPKKGKYLKEAAHSAVDSLFTADKGAKYSDLPAAGRVEKPIPLPRLKLALVKQIDSYVALLPKEKAGHPMRFTAAQTYFDYGHYDEAIKRYDQIIQDIPNSKQANISLKILLGYFSEKKDWEQVVAWSKKYQAKPNLLTKSHRKVLSSMLKAGLFNQALVMDKAEKHAAAAKAFLEFQKKFPSDSNADAALYNASLNFYKLGEVESALAANKLILSKYPKSKTMRDVLLSTAETHESLTQFADAAKYYERFAVYFPKDERAATCLYNAAVLNKGVQNYSQSVKLFERFAKKYKSDERSSVAHLEIAKILEEQKRYADSVKAYDQYASVAKNADSRFFGSAKSAQLTMIHVSKARGNKKFLSIKKELMKKKAISAYDARRVIAEIMMGRADKDLRKYQRAKVNDPNALEKQIAEKQKLLVNQAQEYEKIIDLNNPEYTVAALYRLGEMHEEFSDALFSAPSPKGASQVEVDQFKTQLEKVAFPLREDAQKFYEAAYKRSREVEVFTDWTRKAYEKMAAIAPEKHSDVVEQSSDAAYMAHKLVWSDTVAKLAE